jgi:microcystin-dependent protein
MDPYMANITIFAGNFAPLSWKVCDGSLLPIANYNALYALIGTTYGGDGQTTFALPDMRSRTTIHCGQGPGLSNYLLGQIGGNENTTLMQSNLPAHTHSLISFTGQQPLSTATTGVDVPTNAFPAGGAVLYATQTPDGGQMANYNSLGVTVPAGGGQPISLIQPYLAMNYIICVEGIFPSRN